MDSPDKKPDGRPFRAVSVGTCYAQTANDRFGNGASEAIRERERPAPTFNPLPADPSSDDWPDSDSDDSHAMFFDQKIYQLVPTMQRFRNNLTALSQLYNLYFVAYQGQMFVYAPRSAPRQTIPRHPDVRLAPRPSEASHYVGGYQDPSKPHTINHLVVGDLGSQEILVAAYDDGDVIAYFTKDIEDCIPAAPGGSQPGHNGVPGVRTQKSPQPFLHQNVGKSAWGLAVHRRSRLIAVSSNRCEMTVFALALASSTGKAQKPDRCSECEPGSCRNIEFHVRQRARNWRIVLALGRQADNIPNVSFIDDERGCAELVCGVDIKGAAWLAKIWRPLQAAVRIEPSVCMQFRSTDVWPAPSRGWGVLPLDKSSFLRVNSLQELLGIPSNDVELTRRLMLNIGKCIQRIPNNPCIPERGEEVTGPMLNVEFDVVFGTDDMHDSDQEIPDAAGPSADVENTPADVEAAGADADIDVDAAGHEAELEGDDDAEDILVGGSSVASGETAQALPLDYVPGQQPAHPAAATILSLADPSAVLEGFTIWETPLEGMPAWYSGPGGSSAAPLAFLPNLYSALGAHADGSTASCVPEEGDDGLWSEGGGQDMAYYPHDGRICPIPRETFKLVTFLGGHLYHNELPLGIDDDLEIVFKRYRMLRLHEKELELRSFSPGSHPRSEYGVFCPEAMTMDQDMARATRSLFYATTRLSMVAHLPEISLVIIGSPIGRVLLVTPTQLPRPVAWRVGVVQHGFRVDWVLPRRSDEQNHRKTLRPLHGMAVGPVQEGGDRTSAPRRYRLMLHYRNHDILTYEISRDASSGKLYVF